MFVLRDCRSIIVEAYRFFLQIEPGNSGGKDNPVLKKVDRTRCEGYENWKWL